MSFHHPQSITVEGRRTLETRLQELIRRRPEVIEHIATARVDGDSTENTAYLQAREEQATLEGHIAELEAVLRTAAVIEAPSGADCAQLGSHVTVLDDVGEADYQLVDSLEADPAAGLVSVRSPVGQALLGARPGQTVTAITPDGPRSLLVRTVG
jgi:transcription elongation factor GreA